MSRISFFPAALIPAGGGCPRPRIDPVGPCAHLDGREAAWLLMVLDWQTVAGTGFIDNPVELGVRCQMVAWDDEIHERLRELARQLLVVCDQAVSGECVVGYC